MRENYLPSRPADGWGPNYEEYVDLLQKPATPDVWRRMQVIRDAALTLEDFENFIDQSLAELEAAEQKSSPMDPSENDNYS